jgi:hypothetical protein
MLPPRFAPFHPGQEAGVTMSAVRDDFNDRQVKSVADRGNAASFTLSARYGSR